LASGMMRTISESPLTASKTMAASQMCCSLSARSSAYRPTASRQREFSVAFLKEHFEGIYKLGAPVSAKYLLRSLLKGENREEHRGATTIFHISCQVKPIHLKNSSDMIRSDLSSLPTEVSHRLSAQREVRGNEVIHIKKV